MEESLYEELVRSGKMTKEAYNKLTKAAIQREKEDHWYRIEFLYRKLRLFYFSLKNWILKDWKWIFSTIISLIILVISLINCHNNTKHSEIVPITFADSLSIMSESELKIAIEYDSKYGLSNLMYFYNKEKLNITDPSSLEDLDIKYRSLRKSRINAIYEEEVKRATDKLLKLVE